MKSLLTPKGIGMTASLRTFAIVLVILALSPAAARALVPEPIHQKAGPVVAELLSRYHYNDLAINDTLSQAVYGDYLVSLTITKMSSSSFLNIFSSRAYFSSDSKLSS